MKTPTSSEFHPTGLGSGACHFRQRACTRDFFRTSAFAKNWEWLRGARRVRAPFLDVIVDKTRILLGRNT